MEFIDGYCGARDFCRELNLEEHFLRLKYKKRYDLEIKKISGILFVKPPKWVKNLLEDGYKGFVIKNDDDLKELNINKIYQISNKTKIGFWK